MDNDFDINQKWQKKLLKKYSLFRQSDEYCQLEVIKIVDDLLTYQSLIPHDFSSVQAWSKYFIRISKDSKSDISKINSKNFKSFLSNTDDGIAMIELLLDEDLSLDERLKRVKQEFLNRDRVSLKLSQISYLLSLNNSDRYSIYSQRIYQKSKQFFEIKDNKDGKGIENYLLFNQACISVGSYLLSANLIDDQVCHHTIIPSSLFALNGYLFFDWLDRNDIVVTQLKTSVKKRKKVEKKKNEVKNRIEIKDYKKDIKKRLAKLQSSLLYPQSLVEEIAMVLLDKKNLILQGPPGVGKTYLAKLIGEVINAEDVKTVQFHQSYSYEDFVQGFRPNKKGQLSLVNGLFYQFCQLAKEKLRSPHIIIIDEINRGNINRIFGEIFLLLDSEKRGLEHSVSLTYSPEDVFYIPQNVLLIGTMNTVDRSLTQLDIALRRRFYFISLKPQFNDRLIKFLVNKGMSKSLASHIVKVFTLLNQEIVKDELNLGPGYEVGHSYFLGFDGLKQKEKSWYNQIIDHQIKPLLEQYFSDNHQVKSWEDKLKL